MGRKKVKINPECGKRLKIILEEQNITQKNLSEMINLSQQTISQIIQGKATLTAENVDRIISLFPQYNIYWLLGYDKCKTNDEVLSELKLQAKSMIEKDKEALSAMRSLISFWGYKIVRLSENTIQICDSDLSEALLSIDEAKSLYNELSFMIYSFVKYHFDKHRR